MPCERYQDALIDLAAGGAEAAGDVRAHLDGCALCRAYVEQERSLFTAIDSMMRQTSSAPLPVALLQRFEARFAQQTPSRNAHPSRIYAGAAIATAAALALLVLGNLRTHDAKQQSMVSAESRHETVRQSNRVVQPALSILTLASARHSGKHASQRGSPSEPEVLVPPDERIAFEHFLSDLNGREDLAAALVRPMQEQRQPHIVPVAPPAALEVPDIETAALTVQPLAENTNK